MNNYLIISNDSVTINDSIDKILKKLKLHSENVIKYDASVSLIQDVIEELNTYGFFISNKVVVLSSCLFLSGEKKCGDIDQDESLLEKYINNPNPSNSLIIVADKLDERKKINKLIRKNFIVIEDNLKIEDKIKKNLDDFNMDNFTINYLISYLNNDNCRILNELEKLKLYKLNEKEITKSDIEKIVVRELDDDVFTLINAIVKKDIKKSVEVYKNLLSRGEDLSKIVIMTVDQFRLIYKTKILINQGKGKDTITSMFKIHPYRVKLAMESSYNFTEKELINYIKTLGKIDIDIKMGNVSDELPFEVFLLNII